MTDSTEKKSAGTKETVEQILVAFVLAFIFRCFVIEAFVIPTGSMAPTLLGAHVDYRCPDCGYRYAVNYSSSSRGETAVEPTVSVEVLDRTNNQRKLVERTLHVRCPNCGYRLPRTDPSDPKNQATGAPVKYGDRILVMKYLYLLHEPHRWDVVVFKADRGQQFDARATSFDQNYIKRLVGLPGDTLMLLDGDLYASNVDKPVAALLPEDFAVQVKPTNAQEAMWRIVYDNDYQPRGLPRDYQNAAGNRVELSEPKWSQPWVSSGAGWQNSGRTLSFSSTSSAPGTLQFDPSVAAEREPFTDWLGYAQTKYLREGNSQVDLFRTPTYEGPGPYAVSDVKLTAAYLRQSGTGPLRLRLTKRDDAFTLEISPTGVTLSQQAIDPQTGDPQTVDATTPAIVLARRDDLTSVGVGRPARIEFINADYRVSVRIDGMEVLATTPAQYKPNVAQLLREYQSNLRTPLPTISIEASNQVASLANVSLYRDVYYNNREGTSGRPIVSASPDNFPAGSRNSGLIRLEKDEFFVLGDNTLMSLDGRLWQSFIDFSKDEDLVAGAGRVPKRFMLGKAFFVYWPAAEPPAGFIPLRIVPDFAQMRFIR